jgi:hypothetical protein
MSAVLWFKNSLDGLEKKVLVISRTHFSRPHNAFQFFPFRQFVDDLVQVPHLPGQGIFDFLYPVATDQARDQFGVWIQACLLKKLLKGRLAVNQPLQSLLVKSGQPCYDLVQFLPCPSFFLHLGYIVGKDGGESHFGNLLVVVGCGVHFGGFLVSVTKILPEKRPSRQVLEYA